MADPADRNGVTSPGSRAQAVGGLAIVALMLLREGAFRGAFSGTLGDTDVYSWLNRVEQLRSSGAWFDETVVRVNPPTGHVQHWSRGFDALLMVGGVIGEPLLGFRDALTAWAVVLPVVAGMATVWLFVRLFGDGLTRRGQFALLALFAFNSSIIGVFPAGRADHQILLSPLLVAILAFSILLLRNDAGSRRAAWTWGVTCGVALWIGIELLLAVGMTAVAMVLWWAFHREDGVALHLQRGFLAFTLTSFAALLVENGIEGLWFVELDELSTVIVALGGLTTLLLHGLARWEVRYLPTPIARLGATAAGMALISAFLVIVFPEIRSGLLGDVDPLYNEVRLQRIAEIKPLLTGDFWESVTRATSGLTPLPFAVYGIYANRRELGRDPMWLVLILASTMYVALTLWQVRWAPQATLSLVVLAAYGLQDIMERAARRNPTIRTIPESIALVALLVPVMIIRFAPQPELESAAEACPLMESIDGIMAALGDDPVNVMAFTDSNPELMWRTPHNVFSIPNHRPQPGFTTTYEFFTADRDDAARRIAVEAGIEAVVVCAGGPETVFWETGADTLYERLTTGRSPAWLEPLPPPDPDGNMMLFDVNV